MPLTKRQKEVLDYLVAFETKHGYAPSFEEIGKGLKLTSLATVHKHITTLEKKGFIRRGYNQSRSIEIVQLPKPVKEQVIERKVQELPLVGRIAAGRPLEAIEERETLSLGDFARGGNSYVLQVKGSSMIEDHIMDGDYVVCEQTQVANAGDIVVALVGGEEATLKRLPRCSWKSTAAACQFGHRSHHRSRKRGKDSRPGHRRAAEILSADSEMEKPRRGERRTVGDPWRRSSNPVWQKPGPARDSFSVPRRLRLANCIILNADCRRDFC